MSVVFKRPKALSDRPNTYCPGCTHGVAHRLVAEAIDELDLREIAIGIAPVGCAVFAYEFFNMDFAQAAHGRAPAVATGIKRVLPDRFVFTYQGDGDLAAIGTAEVVHAASRGEQISVIFVNNAIYGMTSGQMAPTTIVGQKTTTTPLGRDPARAGYPIRMSEMLATLPGAAYIARCSLHNPQQIDRAKNAIVKAFRMQVEGRGFSMVELLSNCPTNWGMSPAESLKWIEEHMIPTFPLGVVKDVTAEEVKAGA
jgi:2-oxoglutarate ferredoxin oxidoreductase subunit beta